MVYFQILMRTSGGSLGKRGKMFGVTGDIGSEDMDLINKLILNSPSVSSSPASDYQESGDRDDCSDKCCGGSLDEKIEK